VRSLEAWKQRDRCFVLEIQEGKLKHFTTINKN
jgi:hypothetical protein